jgi:Rps23 Pro-64 3,4-dihydroxylase Tpa1-like proline 4-hydroxylase
VFVKSLNQLGAVSVLISENERLLAEAKDEGLASREFIDDLMHEIRKLNGQIKHQAEEAQAKLEESHPATYRVNNIFATSSLISVRMNSYDLTVNPDLILHEEQTRVKLYSKFRKTSHILDALSRKRRIKIELIGASFRSIDGYAIFDLVPYVLLDNAIKFSPDDQTISVVFDETAMLTKISVC